MSKSIRFVKSSALVALTLLPQILWASPDLSEYELVFSDEFDGPALDAEKWTTSFFWGPWNPINGEEQFYVDSLGLNSDFQYSPFSFSDNGILSITAVPAPQTGAGSAPSQPAPDPLPSDPAYDENNLFWSANPDLNYNENYVEGSRNYLSGIITSAQSYSATHGYFEARLKFPAGQGLWSAFWLLNRQYVERFPEIDIVEFLGHKKDTVHHTMHWIDTFSSEMHMNVSTPTHETKGTDFTAEFHTYGLAWDPKKVRFYVDGELVREITDDEFFISTQSMYIILNLAVGGTWPGSPDETTPFPASYDIDYVRAYERKSFDVITTAVLEENYQLMFSDEFNGSALDSDLWNTALLWGPYKQINNEEQIYIDKLGMHQDHPAEPFEVSAGTLKIRADVIDSADLPEKPIVADPIWKDYPNYQRSNVFPNQDGTRPPDYAEEGGWIPSFSSGALTSYDSFKFVNGYAEARVKLPAGDALWPAFWLLHGYYNGQKPEIDIVEAKGQAPNTTHHSYHYYDYSLSDEGLISSAKEYTLPGAGISEFHTYGVQWDRERIVWYVDGVPVNEITGPHVSKQLSYVLLNLAVGGDFVVEYGDGDEKISAAIPAEMEIDWVRVWQFQAEPDAAKNEFLKKEAESGVLLGDMSVEADPLASAGLYVTAPEASSTSALNDSVELTYSVEKTGIYELYGRFSGPNVTTNSLSVEIGESDTWLWQLSETVNGAYKEDYVSVSGEGRVRVYLTSGIHVVRVYQRESSIRLDWLALEFIAEDAAGDVDGDGVSNSEDVFPNDSSQSGLSTTTAGTADTGDSTDGGTTTGGTSDGGSTTAGTSDSGGTTAGETTAGTTDGGATDAGTTTGGTADGSATAGGTTDGSTTAGVSATPAMITPGAGSVLPGSRVTFNWGTSDTSIVRWIVRVGSASGGRNYFDSIRMDGDARSIEASGLPTDGSVVHVQLLYKPSVTLPWEDVRYTYTAAGN